MYCITHSAGFIIILGCLVAGTKALGGNVMQSLAGGSRGPGAHMIQNNDPYQGLDVTCEGNGRYSVIFEPLQNIQMSRSTYKVTSFIDFEPYLEYFDHFDLYLEKFLENLESFVEDPVFREYK